MDYPLANNSDLTHRS